MAKDFREQLEKEMATECKPCHEGYVQDPDTCKCDVEPWVAVTCEDTQTLTDTCGCLNELGEASEPECHHGYRLDIDLCQCEAPPVCELAEGEEHPCADGQILDKWQCMCVDLPLCPLCGTGFKQDPLTCQCIPLKTEKDVKCPKDGMLVSDTCSCLVENDEGIQVEKDARCPKGFDMNEDCTMCLLNDLALCRPQKCAWGQGWDMDLCMCDYLPECPEGAADACSKEERYDPMTCGCAAKPEKKNGGKAGKDRKPKKPEGGNPEKKKGGRGGN